MNAEWRIRTWPAVAVVTGWAAICGALLVMLLLDQELVEAGRTDLAAFRAEGIAFLPPLLTSAAVGSALILHRPRHPAGWLFMALSLVVLASGLFESFAAYGLFVRQDLRPGADFAAVAGDRSFIPWLMVLGLILLFVPNGYLQGRAARITAVVIVVCGLVTLVLGLVSSFDGTLVADPPVENPLQVDAAIVTPVRVATIVFLHVGLIVAAGMLLMRFRRARGRARQQLRWMALAAVAFPVLIVAAFAAAALNQETILAILGGSFVAVIPLAAGIAVEQDHLFDMDRLISRGLTYSLLTAFLIACYVVVVVFVGQSLSSVGGGSEIAVAVATLATVSIGGPARKFLQTSLDRRFNRREYDAMASIQRFIHEPSPAISVEEALRDAIDDRTLRIAYWIDDREQWVGEDGRSLVPANDGLKSLLVERRGVQIARVSFEDAEGRRHLLEAVLSEAAAEVENARLRAAITLQLREVKESRVRILAAQTEERRRIERNLHDGAQQRLLALAMQLRSAEVSGDGNRQAEAIEAAIAELQVAVRELRDLANGLHPIALSDGGLAGAFAELAGRSPIKVVVNVVSERFPSQLEEAAWFTACEAAANAVKHAAASTVQISAVREADRLLVSVADDGRGGADPAGRGLRGIADRVEAVGGKLQIISPLGGGTIVRLELPCVS